MSRAKFSREHWCIITHMGKRLYLILSFLFVSILIFIFSNALSFPFDFISRLSSTPRAFLYSAVFAEDSSSELDKLKKENLKLREELVNFSEIKKDNEALRSQFVEQFIPSKNLLTARIIGFSGNLENPDSFILDQGLKSGVKKNLAVVSGKVLVGKIGKVTEYNSEVILLFNKNFSTLGVGFKNNASGIVRGLEDFIIFDHVVITDNLSKNEEVVTKGEGNLEGKGVYPDLIIGKIERINKIESKPFQDAIIKSPLEFRKLTTVFIVTE